MFTRLISVRALGLSATAALAVSRFFHFDTVVPIHFGTFPLLTGQAADFAATLEGSATKVRVPESGVAMQF